MNGGRFRIITDQAENSIILIIQKCRSQDDGPYTLTIENQHGSDSVAVKLLVTSDTGLDFRAMLKHRYICDYNTVEDFLSLRKQKLKERNRFRRDKLSNKLLKNRLLYQTLKLQKSDS